KTQTFQEVRYGGYKANRKEMPGDLAQQVPFIRRALEAYRIPILESAGYEADDVIGTLARQAAEKSYPVYVVSSDKDMMQLVDDKICVLNPPKDNLICDAAKVEEILGVPPERVVDVMALRGDSIDNIPGAPGIGDKGSVELIKRFGSVEATLEHAEEVERKTYRESLLNNKDTILLSKQLVTIDRNVPVEFDVHAMEAGEPDIDELRKLFSELEFTSLLKEILPETRIEETNYREAKRSEDLGVLNTLAKGATLAVAIELAVDAEEPAEGEEEEPEDGQLPLQQALATPAVVPVPQKVAFSTAVGNAIVAPLESKETPGLAERVQSVLADAAASKAVHDLKAAIHALEVVGCELGGVRDDSMLYSYLLDPTYSSHALPEVALRRFNLKLSGGLAEAADVTGRLTASLRREVEESGLMHVYDDIDLPLVLVLARMEQAGVKIDCDVLAKMSRRLERDCEAQAREIYEMAGTEFNIGSPKQLGDVLFNKLNLPKPVKYGKGKTISTAADVLEELAQEH